MVLIESDTNVAPRAGHRKMEKIYQSSSNTSNTNNDVHRPSEAQLRWAQFHHKTRAREVKERVDRLWRTPLEVKDVDGALSDDGTSTCSDGSCDSPTQAFPPRRSRPKISRGRRALLKVSQRGYEKRRAFIREQGFRCSSDKENQVREERDEYEGTKRSAKGSRGLPNADEARKHRFEAAYAMMNNLNPANKPVEVRSTKRWTRPKNVHTTNDSSSTNYQDWKWGLARRKRTADTRLSRMTNMPFDRRATWLVHMPTRESSAASRRFKYKLPVSSDGDVLEPVSMHEGTDVLSPGQRKFDEMVSRLQDYDSAPVPEHGMSSLSARYLNCLPTSEPIQSSRVVRQHRTPLDSSLDDQSKNALHSDVRRQRESIGERYAREHLQYHEEEVTPHRRSRSGVGDRYEEYLAQQQGRVSEAHSVGTVGSIDSDFFEKARQMHDTRPLEDGSGGRRYPRQLSALQAIPESSNSSMGKVRSVRRDDDAWNQFEPRDQDGYYRGNDINGMNSNDKSGPASGRDYSFEHHGQYPSSAFPPKSHQDSRPRDIRESIASHDNSTSSSDLQTPRTQIREKGALFDFATPGSDFSEDGRRKVADRNAPVSTASSFRLGAAKVAGGIFQMMTGASRSISDDGSEIRAVAAFRETQKERRGNQDGSTSTSSSFHALPEGLRRLVLGATPSQQDSEERPAYDSGTLDRHSSEPPPSSHQFNQPVFSSDTPERPSTARSTTNSLSPEHGKLVHQKLMEESVMFGENGIAQAIIDTDDTQSDASGSVMDTVTAANLMMSPTILTKRHQQAVKAIERRNWEQITYLLSANPWLAEMMEVTTQQYLLHKVALYGASKFLWSDENDAVDIIQAAPQQLNEDILRMFPSSVHKFDHDGNLPLHMAAASGNIEMAILLGERFASGASVRNNDGMLPLHLAVQACATPLANASGEMVYGADFVALILQLFPGAVAVADNEGELPLHIAAAVLEGEVGVDIIYLLLDEADRQAQSDGGLRFIEKVHSKTDDDSVDDTAMLTASPTDQLDDDIMHCTMVRNEMGRNALTKAIEAGSGWQVIEGLARGPGGTRAALMQDAHGCNALHLLLSEEYGDPQAALSILKIAPATVTVKNADRMLPVEIACRNEMPEEVILAMVLVDSPVDLSRKDIIKMKKGYGGSWWFLTCESDDQFVELVIEVISICNSEHLRELCYMKCGQDGKGAPVLERATPMCREVLEEALSFGMTAYAGDRQRK